MSRGIIVRTGDPGGARHFEDGRRAEIETVTKDGVRVCRVYGRGTGDDEELVGEVSAPADGTLSWHRGEAPSSGGDD